MRSFQWKLEQGISYQLLPSLSRRFSIKILGLLDTLGHSRLEKVTISDGTYTDSNSFSLNFFLMQPHIKTLLETLKNCKSQQKLNSSAGLSTRIEDCLSRHKALYLYILVTFYGILKFQNLQLGGVLQNSWLLNW